jgi:Flp pilus assembly protein TadD
VGIVALRAKSYDLAAHYLSLACDHGRTQEACANLAVLLERAGRRGEAQQIARRAESLAASPWGAYNLACFRVQRGDRKAAIAALRRAYDLGFTDALITTDPDLNELRGDPAFDAEVDRVLDRIRANRQIVTSVFPWQG